MPPMLKVEPFGHILFLTEDLDPLYCALVESNLPRDLLKRWLLAYWMFYHGGVCSRLSMASDFWQEAKKADELKWPRGTERRHFRGQSSALAIEVLSGFDPVELVDYIIGEEPRTFQDIASRAKTLPQFGDWISWKICDMVDRVLGMPVDFGDVVLNIYSDVVKATGMIGERWDEPEITTEQVVHRLLDEFGKYMAPPFYDRPVNVQEMETVMCKIKSHWHHSYALGKDCREVAHGLKGWNDLADHIRSHMPVFPEKLSGAELLKLPDMGVPF